MFRLLDQPKLVAALYRELNWQGVGDVKICWEYRGDCYQLTISASNGFKLPLVIGTVWTDIFVEYCPNFGDKLIEVARSVRNSLTGVINIRIDREHE